MVQEPLASITYTVPKKTVGWIEQTISTKIGSLALHENEIITMENTFPIQSVLDCSYKPFSDGSCLFYLHTIQGVRSFHVNVNPDYFLTAYRRLRGDLYL